MHLRPRQAKKLYFDVIPKTVDEYLTFLARFLQEDAARQLENPVWHIHDGKPPVEKTHLSFNILLNLASVCNSEDKAVLWGFISRYAPDATPQTAPFLDKLVGYAIAYYRDFVTPTKRYRAPSEMERAALAELVRELEALPPAAAAEDIQNRVYEVGKHHPFADLKAWFQSLYEILFGQTQGPRMGTFIALYGIGETIALIRKASAGELART
jgi:lysyl-tRNA synthetase class 1